MRDPLYMIAPLTHEEKIYYSFGSDEKEGGKTKKAKKATCWLDGSC